MKAKLFRRWCKLTATLCPMLKCKASDDINMLIVFWWLQSYLPHNDSFPYYRTHLTLPLHIVDCKTSHISHLKITDSSVNNYRKFPDNIIKWNNLTVILLLSIQGSRTINETTGHLIESTKSRILSSPFGSVFFYFHR